MVGRRRKHNPAEEKTSSSVGAAEPPARTFEQFYSEHAAPVLTYCRFRVHNQHDAEDVAAQVFVKAFAAWPPDDRGSIRSWLFTIAHHTVINYYRRQQPWNRLRSLASPFGHNVSDPAQSPEDIALHEDDLADLERFLNLLNKDQRRVIELRLAGLKGEEIAAVLGKSTNAVKMLQFRAMEQMRSSAQNTLMGEQRKEQPDAV